MLPAFPRVSAAEPSGVGLAQSGHKQGLEEGAGLAQSRWVGWPLLRARLWPGTHTLSSLRSPLSPRMEVLHSPLYR